MRDIIILKVKFHHNFNLKKHLKELKEESSFRLTLISTSRHNEILVIQEKKGFL